MSKSHFLTGRIHLLSALCFALFIAGLFSPIKTEAAAKPAQTVGYINSQQVFNSYPGVQDVMERIQASRAEAQKDYEDNTKNLPPAEKQAYADKVSQKQVQSENKLLQPIRDKINAAIKAVAEEKRLTIVIDGANVVYGGVDLTAEVIKKLKS